MCILDRSATNPCTFAYDYRLQHSNTETDALDITLKVLSEVGNCYAAAIEIARLRGNEPWWQTWPCT